MSTVETGQNYLMTTEIGDDVSGLDETFDFVHSGGND